MNLCEHAEKAESYPGRWVLLHSSLVKNVTFGFAGIVYFCSLDCVLLGSILGPMTWSKFVDIASWPSGEREKVYL